MTKRLPYYERKLDSFADEIITKVRPGSSEATGSLWYAVIDCGPDGWGVGGPDFATCRATKEKAVADCAAKIRRAVRERTYSVLIPGQHCLQFKLMKHWAEKERA